MERIEMKCDIEGCNEQAVGCVEDGVVDTHLCSKHIIDFWYNEQVRKSQLQMVGIL
jgi:hypothetical protein